MYMYSYFRGRKLVYRKKHFTEKIFAGDSKSTKFVKIFSLKKFPLYGTCITSHNHIHVHTCMYMYNHTHSHTCSHACTGLPQPMITDSEGDQDFVIVDDSSSDSEDEEEDEVWKHVEECGVCS